jgi:hypothetical protein
MKKTKEKTKAELLKDELKGLLKYAFLLTGLFMVFHGNYGFGLWIIALAFLMKHMENN